MSKALVAQDSIYHEDATRRQKVKSVQREDSIEIFGYTLATLVHGNPFFKDFDCTVEGSFVVYVIV